MTLGSTRSAGAVWVSLALAVSLRAADKPVRLHGFVVEVESPTLLRVDAYRITEDRVYRVHLQTPAASIRIGTEVQADGSVDASTNEFHAVSIVPRVEPFARIAQRVILSGPPHEGVFEADGHRIRVSPSARIAFAKAKDPFTSLNQVGADAIMAYEASRREPDGTLVADALEFRRNEAEPGERELWKRLEMDLKEPDFDRHKSGGLRIYRRQYYEIVADAEAQRYVGDIGRRLVPAYQRDMPDEAPTKIPFRFYVVKRDEASAVALQNGVVLVYSRLFDVMENEAQLAAAIGHEIAHVTQEHRWQLEKKIPGAFDNAYSRSFENQADRLGLRYMTDAGYDPREWPRVWKVLTVKFGFVLTNAFGGSHDNHALRREYLMSEIEQNYRDLDYGALTIEKDRFARIARLVKGAVDPGWKEKHSR